MNQSRFRPGAVWMTLCGLLQLLLAGSAQGQPAAPSGAQPLAGEPGGRRVILVHGIYNSGKWMRGVRRVLESRGWQVYAISLRPNDASIPFEAMAQQLDAFVSANIPSGEKFDLVGFSMGGLVCRCYIQKMGGYRRVRRFVTLSTPNHGTLWALLSGRAGVKEMRPGSEMLDELNGDVSKLASLDYTSIYTPLDLTIVPPSSSRMKVARNVISWVPFHALMIWMPGPIRAVEQALE
jgi:triacylglycerol lipase